jgi:hypothetical protein
MREDVAYPLCDREICPPNTKLDPQCRLAKRDESIVSPNRLGERMHYVADFLRILRQHGRGGHVDFENIR